MACLAMLTIIGASPTNASVIDVLEYGGIALNDPTGSYEFRIINPGSVKPWEPTLITADVASLTINNLSQLAPGDGYKSKIKDSSVSGQLFFNRSQMGIRSHMTIDNSYIAGLFLEETNTVTIGPTSKIGSINSINGVQPSIFINYGVVEGSGKVDLLYNYGIATLNGDGNLIENHAGGDLHIKAGKMGEIKIDVLKNAGQIHVDETTLLGINSLYNDGTIESDGINTVGAGLGATHINNGTILNTNTSEQSGGSAITMLVTEDEQPTRILNLGNIIADSIAISYVTELGGKNPLLVYNGGVIQGGIYKTKSDHDVDIMVTNGKYGHWSSMFGEIITGQKTLISRYAEINNLGTITNLKRPDGLPGEIETGTFKNGGTIDIQQGPLVIVGNYKAGTGARLFTGGALGGDETQLPTLTIHGTVSGETTHVLVDNIGGTGAATTDGILVVRADTVDGEGFTKEGRIVAGAYDYDIVRVESGDHTEWRLTSALTPVPPGPVPPVPPGPEPGPEPVPPAPVHVVRPEAVTYAENLRQANTLFMTDSEQRRAVGEYTDPVTGRTETSSLWLSQTGGHSTRHDASGQLKSDYNRYTVQLGGTLLSLPAGDDGRLEAGVQAGYGHARGNTRSGLTGYRARGTVSGYSTGLYGTWRQHRDGQSGAYVSTTLQYSWLKNQVKGDDLAAEKYDARGTTLSLEGGYDYAVWQGGEQNGDSLFIRPHAQVTRMGVKADEHREVNGTRVSQQGDGSVFSRTGVRVWLDKAVSKGQRVQPFVETNWLHNTRDFCSSMDGVRDCLAGNRNQAEVLAGVRGDVSPDVAVTAQAGGRFGSQAGRDLAGTLNVSVKF